MDKYFEALEKSKNQVTLGVLGQVGFDETAEVLEKGKKAAMGEIREWNGIKYQKTPKGWTLVKKQEGVSKTGPEKQETKVKGSDLLNMNYSEVRTKGPKILGDVMGLKSSNYGQQFLRKKGDDFFFEPVESINPKEGINRLIIRPTEFSKKLGDKSVQKKLEDFFGIKVERDTIGNGEFFAYIIDKPKANASEIENKKDEEENLKITKETIKDVVSDTVLSWIEYMDWDTKPDTGEELLEDEDFVQSLFDDWSEAFSPEKDEDDIREHWEDVEKVVSEIYDGYMEDHKREDED